MVIKPRDKTANAKSRPASGATAMMRSANVSDAVWDSIADRMEQAKSAKSDVASASEDAASEQGSANGSGGGGKKKKQKEKKMLLHFG